jgi:hypothetical protein
MWQLMWQLMLTPLLSKTTKPAPSITRNQPAFT